MWAGVAAALPALLLAATGWMEAQAQKEKKLDLADNYRAYIEEQMLAGSHVEESLASCLRTNEHLVAVRGAGPLRCEECPPCAELFPADYPTAAEAAPE